MTEIYKNYKAAKESTFKIGGEIDVAAFPTSIQELIDLLKTNEYDLVLGNCSNVLFSSEKINKKIIFTRLLNNYSSDGNKILAECGVKGPILSKHCQEKSLTGFEFLIGFPGSIGGMVRMNASAHNQSISDVLLWAEVYNKQSRLIEKLSKDELQFGYRKSIINDKYIVIRAEFELKSAKSEDIDELMRRNIEFRRNHQPSLSYGNAGSVFKNPQNDSAGRLLDMCALKGASIGGACVYEKHANFIINKNNALSSDVIKLMYKMYSDVKEKYTIELEPEIIYIGNSNTEEAEIWKKMLKENMEMTQR